VNGMVALDLDIEIIIKISLKKNPILRFSHNFLRHRDGILVPRLVTGSHGRGNRSSRSPIDISSSIESAVQRRTRRLTRCTDSSDRSILTRAHHCPYPYITVPSRPSGLPSPPACNLSLADLVVFIINTLPQIALL